MKYLRLLLVIASVLFFGGLCAGSYYKKEYENFVSIAGKAVPGVPLVTSFKQSNEIPEFDKSSYQDKEQWNVLAKQMDKLLQEFAEHNKEFDTHPIVVNYQKIRDELWEKEELAEKKIKKIVEKDSRVRKIRKKLESSNAEAKSAWKKWKSFSDEKVEPIRRKQEKLIAKAYEEKYGSSSAQWRIPIRETETFEAKIKKTKQYKNLEDLLKPLEKQKKLLWQRSEDFQEKRAPLYDELRAIRKDIKQSENLPESLNKLMKTISQLEIEEKELRPKYKKFDVDEANKIKYVTDSIVSVREKLFDLYKKMVK